MLVVHKLRNIVTKNICRLSLFLVGAVCGNVFANSYLLDAIVSVVYTPEGTEIVTKSDLDRPGLGGDVRSLDDIIFENLVFLDAKKHKVLPDEEMLEAYLMTIQREHNLTREGLQGVFTAAGYTYEEGRAQLQMMQTINTMMDFKIRSNLIVPRKDIVAYYEEHPQIIEASYQLQRTEISYSLTKSKTVQKKELIQFSKTEKGMSGIVWSEPFFINHSDIAAEKKFIMQMSPGDISLPVEVDGGFELFRLKSKKERRLRTLDERYREIADILRQPKYEELLQTYKKSLFDTASIVYF